MSRYNILRPLKPFKANHSSSAAPRFAAIDAALSKFIDLLPSNSRLGSLNTIFHRDPNPRIRDVTVEFVRIETMNNAPRLSIQHNNLFCRAESRTLYPDSQPLVYFIRAAWRD